MLHDITLLIPTFNRKKYLDRILKYYATPAIKIIIADSSINPYTGCQEMQHVEYLHLPGENFPRKIAIALSMVTTKFVVMCADDDFIIPDGIKECISFLNSNQDFAAAQGNSLSYRKKKLLEGKLGFSVMYKKYLSYTISQNDPFKRAERLFDPYRTIFSAVHYTKNLQLAYNKRTEISNLYLSEYLSGIIPITLGKFIELPVFFQVRESAEDSGDKTTDNLNVIIHSPAYSEEYKNFLYHVSETISSIAGCTADIVLLHIQGIFNNFSQSVIPEREKNKSLPILKRLKNFMYRIPAVCRKWILKIGKIGKGPTIRLVIKTDKDKKNLEEIADLIKNYAQAISNKDQT